MQAAIFSEHGGPEMVRLTDMPIPAPGPGEVRIRVRASSMNHLDLWSRRGLPFDITMPHIGGSDIAGEVEAAGAGVEHVALGSRVVVDPSLDYEHTMGGRAGQGLGRVAYRLLGEHTQGGFAEFATVPAANLLAVPEAVSFETAAAAGLVTVTAWRGLRARGGLVAGESVLITGASGGVSTAAIQIAKLAGAKVFAVTSGAENCERVRALGADMVYDRTEVDFGREVWRDTGKRGVDLVLDSVGAAIWDQNLRALAQRGRLVTYGATTGAKAEVDVRIVFWKQLSILGTTMGSPTQFREAMNLVFDGAVKPVVHDVWPLDRAREAHELLEAGGVFGKLVLVPGGEGR